MRAAGTCRVFVPLLSKGYVASEWCGRELGVFSPRRVITADGRPAGAQAAMLQVLWVPIPADLRIPTPLKGVQRFSLPDLRDSEISALYQRNGLYGLLTRRAEDAYAVVAWELAQRIATIYHEVQVEPSVPPDPDDVPDVFEGEGR